ncbi:uncharacterized protein TNCV_3934781 [Trichonephila clavipes]|nr:uncharacterized protein TNCV_3934781 [Trichonephila clavipes]
MSQEALVDHRFVRLEPQVQDYVNVRNPQNTVQLLEVLSQFEERYSFKVMRGSRNSDIVERRVELPCVPILLNTTFTKALWDNMARRSHLYPRRISKIFFYKQVKKSRAQVTTAQGAKCQNIGIVELNVRIRVFEKLWLFHVLADLEYPCILGMNFISGSKITLDFDRKSLGIPDSQIDKVVKTIEEGKVEIDLSKTRLEEK